MVSVEDFVEFDITKEDEEWASIEASWLNDKLGSTSILRGAGTKAGFVAKANALSYLKVNYVRHPNYDFQIGELKVSVKSKQTSVSYVLPSFEASVTATQQKVLNAYLFARVNMNAKKVWLLGWLPLVTFNELSRYVPMGTHDPSNKFNARSDCYNITYGKCYPMKDLHLLHTYTLQEYVKQRTNQRTSLDQFLGV
jgi:hypothetical protein